MHEVNQHHSYNDEADNTNDKGEEKESLKPNGVFKWVFVFHNRCVSVARTAVSAIATAVTAVTGIVAVTTAAKVGLIYTARYDKKSQRTPKRPGQHRARMYKVKQHHSYDDEADY